MRDRARLAGGSVSVELPHGDVASVEARFEIVRPAYDLALRPGQELAQKPDRRQLHSPLHATHFVSSPLARPVPFRSAGAQQAQKNTARMGARLLRVQGSVAILVSPLEDDFDVIEVFVLG